MNYLAIGTWICIGLGFLVNPIFFIIGLVLFVIVATMWTFQAIQARTPFLTIVGVWAIPIFCALIFGFAFMYLPSTTNEYYE